jgi:microcompartment protein CcmL/EutN
MNAIGIIETSSIAKGIELGDMMAKASNIQIIEAIPMCPGKFTILIGGQVADVKNSVEVAVDNADASLIDSLVIPNIDPRIFMAINQTSEVTSINALGIIETYSAASGVLAADIAVKAASVDLVEVRLSRGMGGKALITLTGSVSDVTAAVNSATEGIKGDGLLAGTVIIPSPHEDLKRFIR